MTIRPGQPSRKLPTSGVSKSSSKGMDVVMMNDFEQRHLNTKSRSHSPFGHIGSPTTPLNFEQLFLQGQFPLSSELSQHEQAMLQAQLLNGMRTSGMAPKSKQQSHQPSLAMLDQLRQAYNRSEQEHASQEQAEWNVRAFAGQQHRDEPSTEPSTIALLQQKFAQMERHKAEMQKSANQPQQVQIYPSQWSMSVQQQQQPQQVSNSMPPPPPPVSHESRHFVPTTAGFYSFQQQQQPQVMAPPPNEVSEQFYSTKQELSWGASQESRPSAGWTLGNEIGTKNPSLMYMPPKQQPFQHQAPKVVEYQPALQQQQQQQQRHRVPEFAVPPQQIPSFTSFQLNGPPAPEMGLLGSVVVSSRCDKTGGQSVEFKSVPDHFRSDDSEMSLDNFSGRVGAHIPQPNLSSLPNASQIAFGNSFHMLPQSSKSAFSTFTRQSSNLNPATTTEAVVTKSLLFNDTYRRSQEVPDLMHDDVDTELHL